MQFIRSSIRVESIRKCFIEAEVNSYVVISMSKCTTPNSDEAEDLGGLNALPPEIRRQYLADIKYHHKLLERLAQR